MTRTTGVSASPPGDGAAESESARGSPEPGLAIVPLGVVPLTPSCFLRALGKPETGDVAVAGLSPGTSSPPGAHAATPVHPPQMLPGQIDGQAAVTFTGRCRGARRPCHGRVRRPPDLERRRGRHR